MDEPEQPLRAIFLAALEIQDSQRRAAYLSRACGGDTALRAQVEELLEANASAVGGFLPDKPGASADPQPLMAGGKASRDPEGCLNDRASEQIGQWIGRYRRLEKIGEGGCGIVYMAEQQEPVRRRVALKVIKLGMDTKQVIARFDAERQALVLMDHPNIARVFDAGATAAGRPYFVMELVRGIRITTYCDQHRLSARERLELFIQVCQAVQHAHQKGIIHRDLKPSNILVTEHDGVAVPAVPKVIDFGIAKATVGRLTDQTLFTAFEQFLGTPDYMSPEQAAMTSEDIDTRSDIYSLGVLLYELLTGTTPFDTKALLAAGLDELRRTIREQPPPRPSTRLTQVLATAGGKKPRAGAAPGNSGSAVQDARSPWLLDRKELIRSLRGDLDWIVMKCLEKDRNRRYETANGLARDIARHLNRELVQARPQSRLYEFQKTVRRHKAGFGATAAIIVALALGAAGSSMEAHRARRAETKQIGLRLRAEAAEADAKQKLRDSYLAQARAVRWSQRVGRRFEGLKLLRKAAQIRPGLDLRNEAIGCMALADIRARGEVAPRGVAASMITVRGQILAFDGKYERYIFNDQLGVIHVRRVEDSAELMSFPGYELPFCDIQCDATGRFALVSCGKRGDRIELLDLNRKTLAHRFTGPDYRTSDFSRDGRLFAITYDWTNQNWPIQVFDLRSFQQVGSFLAGRLPYSIRFNPRNVNQLLVSDTSDTVRLWDWQTGHVVQSFHHPNGVVAIAWHPGGERMATGCADNNIRIWDVRTGTQRLLLAGHEGWPRRLTLSFDGQFLLSSGWDGMLRLWEFDTGSELLRQPVESDLIGNFGVDNSRFCTFSGRQKVQIFEASSPEGYRALRPPPDQPATFCAFSPAGQRLFSMDDGGTIHLWDPATGKLLSTFHESRWHGFLVPHPGGTNLFVASGTGIEEMALAADSSGKYSLRPSRTFPLDSQLSRLFLTRGGQTLVSASVGGGVHFFDVGPSVQGQDLLSAGSR